MPKQLVFPCPSCGATLSADEGAATASCQFCGSTVTVPKTLRGEAQPGSTPQAAPAPGSSAPGLDYGFDRMKYVPVMTPVIPDTNRIWRGVMGFNIALTVAIFLFTACIVVFVFLAIGMAFVPALFGGLGPLLHR